MKPWQLQEVRLEQTAPFLRILPGFLAGILLYDTHGTPDLTSLVLLVACAILPTVLLLSRTTRTQAGRASLPGSLLLSLLFLLAGWTRSWYADERHAPRWFGAYVSTAESFVVTLLDEPVAREKTYRARVAVIRAIGNGVVVPVHGEGRLYIFRESLHPFNHRAGDTLLLPSRWQPVVNSGNPFSYDFALAARRNGVSLQQFLSSEDILVAGRHDSSATPLLERLHNWCTAQLHAVLGDGPAFGLLQAMLLGDERDFDPELRETYSETGVVHIVSISGSHTALLFAIVAAAFGWIKKRRWQWIKFLPGIAIVWCYVLMAGAPPSALRSAVMFTLFAVGAATGRDHQPLNTLLAAGFLLLMADPASLFALGFQLSFLAVLSLLIFYKPIYYFLQRTYPARHKFGSATYAACAASIAAEILTAPLVMYHFHNFPVLFLPANILASVLLGLVCMIGGLVLLAFAWWPAAAGLCGSVITFTVRMFDSILLWLNGWSPAWSRHIQLSTPELILFYVIITAISIGMLQRLRQGALIALSGSCLLMLLFIVDDLQARRQDRLVAFSGGRNVRVDAYRGKSVVTLAGQPVSSKHAAAKDAAIGYRAWSESAVDDREVFSAAGRRVLLLRKPLQPDTARFPVGVTLVGYGVRPGELVELWRSFPADTLVLAGWQSRRSVARLEDTARRYGIPLHLTAKKGAFILE